MIVIIDNFDSFVHNIARYLRELGFLTGIFRNNAITLEQIEALKPSHIILSPGPCTPDEAGITLDVIHYFAGSIPILGICLGHQAIGQAFGGKILKAIAPTHGKAVWIEHQGQGIFKDLAMPMAVGLYHSLAVSPIDLPKCLTITAKTANGEIMALQHRDYPITGLQFHPESILTEQGYQLFMNFLGKAQATDTNP